MVINDPFEQPKPSDLASDQRGKTHSALPLDRIASHVADLVLLAPIMALAMAPFRRAVTEARLLDRMVESDIAIVQSLFAAIFVGIIWETAFVTFWGTTPGRAIFGLRIVDVWTGEKPRAFHAFLRALAWWGSALILGAPFFGVYSNTKRRPVHDRVADTEVRSVNTRRQSSPPKMTELAFGSLLTTATLFFASLVFTTQMIVVREHSDQATAAAEPKLCEEVTVAQEDWEKQDRVPPRIAVALSLTAAGYVDSDCLETEADYALWNNNGRLLGYLSKGLARFSQEPEDSEKYFAKVCDLEPDSDACRLVGWYRDLANAKETDTVEDADLPDKIETLARTMIAPSTRVARTGAEAPDWYRLIVLKELFLQRADPELTLKLTKESGRHLAIGAKLVEYRARALWRLGQKQEAKSTVFASADALPRRSRVVVTSWLCSRELYESSCSADAFRACEMMEGAADEANGDFAVPSFLLASARHAECRIGKGRGTSNLLASLAKHVVEDRGRDLFESIRLLRSSERQKGLELLRKIAASDEQDEDLFVTEANIRLIEELAKLPVADREVNKELLALRERWFTSSGARRYADWGRALFDALVNRGEWNKATEVGVLLGSDFEFDRGLQNRIAVAAWKAGKQKLAAELLDSVEKTRFPASLNEKVSEKVSGRSDDYFNDSEVIEAIRRSGRRK